MDKGNKAKYLEELSKLVKVPNFLVFTDSNNIDISSLSGDYFAVRSSSVNEDTKMTAAAGKYKTWLYVPRNDIQEKVMELLKKGIAAIVQEMVIEPDFSGVCFTNLQKYTEVYYINEGLCESIVNGEANTINFYRNVNSLTKQNLKPKLKRVFNGKDGTELVPVSDNFDCSEEEIKNLFSIIDTLDEHFDFKLDIEFSVKNGEFIGLQIRPIALNINEWE